jgi:predicted DNA-binding transcriptional regulator YafY
LKNKDGSIIFKVIVQGTRELKWWIYHWIPHVEILSPPELRKKVTEEMREMVRVYEKS